MKVVVLAGGLGTRLGVSPGQTPKPLVEIGGRPILAHLMEFCAWQGATEFIIALGHYRKEIEDYLGNRRREGLAGVQDIIWVDTGLDAMTGGRLKRLGGWLRGEPYFLMTYVDGLADIDLGALVRFHQSHGKLATVTAVRVPERFGRLRLNGDVVERFQEKPDEHPWINGGFFVLNPKVLDYIDGDETIWEREPLQQLCTDGELRAFRHEGFWSCLDTPNDLAYLESLWQSGAAPWKALHAPRVG
jgi:glucose-1-phosphate cytidylyltransferase